MDSFYPYSLFEIDPPFLKSFISTKLRVSGRTGGIFVSQVPQHLLQVTPTNSSQSDTLQVKSPHSCKTLLHGYFFWELSLSQNNKVGGYPRRVGMV